jgi:tRNA dimethylallyltransferase
MTVRTATRPPGRHLVLVGPTASGKSALSVALARRRTDRGEPTEVVSCDSMAVYRGMDVGTATPSAEERAGVPHHLLSVVEPTEEFSVQRFVELADAALDDVESRGASAVLVGGTGLYVQALTDGFDLPGRYPQVLAELEPLTTEELTARLTVLDPLAASRVPPGNRRRLLRALEVTIGSGRPFSASGPGLTAFPPTPFVLTGLTVPREEIARRIAERYERQMAAGFLDEVTALAELGDRLSRTAAEALGYRELLAHLRGEVSLDDALAEAVRRTRRFAVRQERWFRRDPRIEWFDGTAPADELVRRLDERWAAAATGGPGGGSTGPAAAGSAGGASHRSGPIVDPAAGDRPTTVDPSCCD